LESSVVVMTSPPMPRRNVGPLQGSADEARRLPKSVVYHTKENSMGKYFIAWLLGVPAVVLVVAYLFFH
jgi:hypothetical protein